MRFQTRLFIIWGVIVLLLWAGTGWPVRHAIETTFTRLAADGFAATRRDLHTLQAERVRGMRQAAAMVMNIPELRALIAEQNFEVSSENLASLQERLDNLAEIVGVSFVCVLDARGNVIAQNHASPWKTLPELDRYLTTSAPGKAMLHKVFAGGASAINTASANAFGMWPYQQRLYQVVGVPLVFNSNGGQATVADGGLVMAAPLTDELASGLAQSHKCQVSFLSDGAVAACSLPPRQRTDLQNKAAAWGAATEHVFDTQLDGTSYRSSIDPLIDPCSDVPVGAMLIQSDLKDALAARDSVSRRLLVSMFCGLLAAGLASFFVSGAVTRPVAKLNKAVQRLARCDLDINLQVHGRDELGELAAAFNDMVRQLRVRRELERVVEETRANSRAKSQFLANMSHEIRTPINGVIGMAELLLRSNLDDRQKRYAGMVKSSAEVLTTLINDILDFSKIEAGKLELESVEFNLHDLIEDVVEMLGLKAMAKGLDVACDIGRDVPAHVQGDSTRVRQIIVNLLNNAIKFTERGHVIVRASIDAGEPGKSGIRVEVIDTGIGIPPDRMDRLFQSFSQVDASTTRRFGGTGLGLAISKELAELMGGKMGVSSEPGKGSVFNFTIPLQPSRPPTAMNEDLPAELHRASILVVEPNNVCREILCRKIVELGCKVDGKGDGPSATEAISGAQSDGAPYRIAIIDAATCSREALGERSDLAILSLVPLGTETGAAGYVTKPVRRAQLIQALRSAIAGPAAAEVPTPSTAVPAVSASIGGPNETGGKPVPHQFRILVAEDNPINQMVASELLATEGYGCDVVGDGEAAVSAFERGGYDLILMDCQMPNLDGFQATAAIRSREQCTQGRTGTVNRVPIIALTANAGDGDRAMCLAAGMDCHCAKPFNANQLLGTIRSLLPKTVAPPSRLCASKAEEDTSKAGRLCHEPDVVTPAPFDTDAFLRRCTGSATLAFTILDKFEKQSAEVLENVKRSLEGSEFPEIARVAHRLKGTAGILSADVLHATASRLEEVSRAGDVICITEGVHQLDRDIRDCIAYLATARERLSSDGKMADKQTVGGIRCES